MADAHLNGSLNLASTETVFRTVGSIAGDSVDKIRDGETGDRQGWIAALIPKLRNVPQLEARQLQTGYGVKIEFSLRNGIEADEIEVPELGYAEAARQAYPVFARLREEGAIPACARFQVSLPTVTAGCEPFIATDQRETFEPAYARRLRTEVEEVLAAIPHEDLAMQWDVAVEMGIVEQVMQSHYIDPFNGVVGRLGELSSWVPEDVWLGYHLCYGDAPGKDGTGKHWKEPADTAQLVAVANAVTQRAGRPLHWFSMPVPIDRDDDAYFEPLSDLKLHDGARLYLGLVHHQDGVEGTQRRIDGAKRHASGFWRRHRVRDGAQAARGGTRAAGNPGAGARVALPGISRS